MARMAGPDCVVMCTLIKYVYNYSILYMVGKLTSNSTILTRGLVEYVPARGFFRVVPSRNGKKIATSGHNSLYVKQTVIIFRFSSASGNKRSKTK